MCTAIVWTGPGPAVLLAGIRDEFMGRAWEPPARHWPHYPGLIGGRDLVAGGTWLALRPGPRPRVACVLNGRGAMAPEQARISRGILPLQAAADGKLAQPRLAGFDPFHLLIAEPGRTVLASWDGAHLTERELPGGLHLIVNSGLDSDVLTGPPGDQAAPGRDRELARLRHFGPLLSAAIRPEPRPGEPAAQAWGEWFPLLNGAGLATGDQRALILRHEFADGRVWGTTSISLVALSPGQARYDFTGQPGEPAAWQAIPLAQER
jgi:hypothetical protein